MLFEGCKTDELSYSVFNFVHTEIFVDHINKLFTSKVLHLDAHKLATAQALNFSKVKVVFFEINAPAAIQDSIHAIKNIRQSNQTACIFVIATQLKTFSSADCYVAGADYCLKLPNDPEERHTLLSKTIQKSHWATPIQLHLDRTRLLLCSASEKIEISYTEMTILDALMQAPEHVMSQDGIAKTLHPNIVFYDPRALEKTISRLRTKIKKTYHLELIFSVRGYGYRLRRGTVLG
ncbi:response regulator receiver protein [Pseudomonas endophytica]|uniref:Response regulator receiver protein n=1 Tax=Pseudomonas endophytica TaxID=1563157 RepID=A0A0Q0X6E1_9PSED|nr:winged helix-turn-helix domain-containing protein [Pseudomonas endophytica]KQB52586.1 response regulator receiver protein [Pseudomonas endophytica]